MEPVSRKLPLLRVDRHVNNQTVFNLQGEFQETMSFTLNDKQEKRAEAETCGSQ